MNETQQLTALHKDVILASCPAQTTDTFNNI